MDANKKISLPKNRLVVLLFLALVFVLGGVDFGAEEGAEESVKLARYRIFRLRDMSAERAQELLRQINIDSVSRLPGTDTTLLVTAEAKELIAASAIMRLADSQKKYVLRRILSAEEFRQIPDPEKLEERLESTSVGSFSEPPTRTARHAAILDVLGDDVVLVAEADRIDRIIQAIKTPAEDEDASLDSAATSELGAQAAGKSTGSKKTELVEEPESKTADEFAKPAQAATESALAEVNEPADVNKTEKDELFDTLLSSIRRAEKEAEEQQQAQTEPEAEKEDKAVSPEPYQTKRPGGEEAQTEQVQRSRGEENGKIAPVKKEEPAKGVSQPPVEPGTVPSSKSGKIDLGPSLTKEDTDAQVRSYQPNNIKNADETLIPDLPEKLQIEQLLRLVGEYLDLDYMYDPAQIKGEVKLKIRGPIKVKDLYPLLQSVLKFQDFVMTRDGNMVTIVKKIDGVKIDPAFEPGPGEIQVGDGIITRVFKLNHITTDNAMNLLNTMKLGTSIAHIKENGTLIVTAYTYRMPRIEKLLSVMDRPGEPKEFRFRTLEYTIAENIAPKVETLVEQMGEISITISEPPAKQAQARPQPRPRPSSQQASQQGPKNGVYLDADVRTNRILMIGKAEDLEVVEDLIDTLDVEKKDLRQLRLYDIQYVGAEEVVDKLKELDIISGTSTSGVSRRITSTSNKPAKAGGAQPSGAQQDKFKEEPQVVVVEATNSLLVNATPEQHLQVATIIAYVDCETLERAINYRIYPLENQAPEDIAGILQKLVQEVVKDKEGKIEKTIQKQEDQIIIVDDEKSFSLIVYANKKNQEWISKLIEQLDKRRPQVLIDTTLVEIEATDAFNYDLQLVSKFPKLEPGETMDKLGALLSPEGEGFPAKTIIEAVSELGEASPAEGFYADRHIQALLSLMQTKGYGRVLAKPKILVNDNEEGIIKTENVLYAMRSKETGAAESGFVSTSYNVESYPSGIELTITPHISEGDLLRLEIEMKRSSQPPPAGKLGEKDPPPNKTENTINTIVTVPDKSTIILGGILTLDQTKDNWKVPLLGDIPVIGGIFRKIDNSSRQSKLYIFVKAHILRPSETEAGLPDLQRISDRNREAFERYEDKFQKDQSWPGVEGEPMDPVKVLETE